MTDKPTEGAAAHVGVEEQIARLQAMVDSSAEWAERSGLEDHGYNKLQRSVLATLRSHAATADALAAPQAAPAVSEKGEVRIVSAFAPLGDITNHHINQVYDVAGFHMVRADALDAKSAECEVLRGQRDYAVKSNAKNHELLDAATKRAETAEKQLSSYTKKHKDMDRW